MGWNTGLFQFLRGKSKGEPLLRVLPYTANQEAPGLGEEAGTGGRRRMRGDRRQQ